MTNFPSILGRTVSRTILLMISSLLAGPLATATPVTAIEIHTDPSPARVRPRESLVLQLRAYGDKSDANGGKRRVRLQREVTGFRFQTDKGLLSKPFRFQGPDNEGFGTDPVENKPKGWLKILLGQAEREFVLQDSVLFTAPDDPGPVHVKVSLAGKSASITVHVDSNAPSLVVPEKTTFPPTFPRAGERELELARHYAPFVAQETWFEPKSDYLARFDFDGDWEGDNNWDSAATGSSQAYVYYAVMETETHWFIVYSFFHPRDYSDKCVAGTCHENDSEGMIVTIRKGDSPLGTLEVMETLAHDNIYSYANDPRVKAGVHGLDGRIQLIDGDHPAVFIESGGHGVFSIDDNRARYNLDGDRFNDGTGVTYTYRARAERPSSANSRLVGYQLLPAYEELWLRATGEPSRDTRTFAEYFDYHPYGNRPRPTDPRIPEAFYGRAKGSNKAKPFWGWHDRRTEKKKVLSTGQWGLDPAYGVSRNLRLPEPFSLDYAFNLFLGIGSREGRPGRE